MVNFGNVTPQNIVSHKSHIEMTKHIQLWEVTNHTDINHGRRKNVH